MRQADAFLAGRDGAGAGGVDVAEHDDPVRPPVPCGAFEGDHRVADLFGVRAGSDAQMQVWGGDAEVGEEGVRHFAVVVLAGVDEARLQMAGMAAQFAQKGCDLHEVRARGCNRHDPKCLHRREVYLQQKSKAMFMATLSGS